MTNHEKFKADLTEWCEATLFTSSGHQMLEHPAMQRIIAMGEEAIPWILDELQRDLGWYFIALYGITGEQPHPDKDAGKFDVIVEAWLTWGCERGYIDA